MKKILIFLLTILMLLSFSMFVACDNEDGDDSSTPATTKFMLSSFDGYDDIATIYLYNAGDNDPDFYGRFERNKDPQYIFEGSGSYKVTITGIESNGAQPKFKMKAGELNNGGKTDITDVVEFGLSVYSLASYEFEVFVGAINSSNAKVYFQSQTVKPGPNTLVFPVNRKTMQSAGKGITNYLITFSGISASKTNKTVFYLDDFYATVSNEPIVLSQEIKNIISGINDLDKNNRAAAEALMLRYKALNDEDKLSVYNFDILKTIMDTFWNQDLKAAETSEPSTLLHFDKPFGEAHIASCGDIVQSYEITTERAYGNEASSLKLSLGNGATPWNAWSTTITRQLSETAYLEFYVYNESDQYKGLKIDWSYPGSGFITIPKNEWFKIVTPASDYTWRGLMNFVGIAENGYSAQVPRGNLYFSKFIIRDYANELIELRKEADVLFPFDTDLPSAFQFNSGISMYNITTSDVQYTTDFRYGDEAGSTSFAVTLNECSLVRSILFYDTKGYEFNDGDMVVWHAYLDVIAAKDGDATGATMAFRFSNDATLTYGTTLRQGEWVTIAVPAETFERDWDPDGIADVAKDARQFWFTPSENVNAKVYFSCANVISAEEYADITDTSTTYSIGSVNFVGYEENNTGLARTDDPDATGVINRKVFAHDSNIKPFYINGQIRFHVANYAEFDPTPNPHATLKFATALVPASKQITIALRGATVDQIAIELASSTNTGVSYKLTSTSAESTACGYVNYTFTVPASATSNVDLLRVFPVGSAYTGTYRQISINNINIA